MGLHKIKKEVNRILSLFKKCNREENMEKQDKVGTQEKIPSHKPSKKKWHPRLKTKFSSRFDWKKLLK